MTPNQRAALVNMALAGWEPEYPGQKRPTLVVWFAGEDERGLSGFYLNEDRDNFHAGQSGPFLRLVTGNSFPQMPARIAQEQSE